MKVARKGGFLISRIHQISGRIFSKKLKEYNIKINPGQGRILFALWEQDGISIRDLAKRTSLGKSTLSAMLKRMRNDGYLKIEHPVGNERKKLVYVLERSKEIEAGYQQISAEMNALYYKGFKNAEIDEFEAYLERLFTNLRKSSEEK
ncbi:MarR family winged helix-turn-helix transcriptional regulator [Candidatus Lokiarchaeum ossiferum]|uniref:MarR family winged helix-turn-helix transcriptional regulator n=1 Tax=Candidatus Lokiarchaeum ossiferum TaxID=2951803 RepID=UPI00352F1C50